MSGKRSGGTLERPLVVARRWDQLAGRLNTMTNAVVVAELAEMDFRFIWVRGFDRHVNDPLELFDRAFLDAYEIEESDLEGRPAVNFYRLQPTVASTSGALSEAGEGAFLEMEEVFGIVAVEGEDTELTRARFKRAFAATGWNSEVQRILAFAEKCPELDQAAAIHIRAGDIVSGSWRHTLVHSKYCPTPFLHHAIERLTGDGGRVLVLGDHPAYVKWLQEHFDVVTSVDVMPGYGDLTELQQALADMALMARCQPILGPPASGFSLLAAKLGAGEFCRADMLAAGSECETLLAGVAERAADAGRAAFWGPLIARDACWAIDVFGDSLPLSRQEELALTATRSDPGFGGAHTRLARIATLRGEFALARDAAQTGKRLARPEPGADPTAGTNPLAEALVAQITVECFAAIHAEAGLRRIVQRRLRREMFDLSDTEDALRHCLQLHPYWIEEGDAWESLRLLVATTRQVIQAGPATRRRVARRVTAGRYERNVRSVAEPDGLARHRAAEIFDALTPDLDRVCLHLYEATRRAGLITDEPRLGLARSEKADR